MRETLIRRLLVIVLCASGVVALWIVADQAVSTPDAASSAGPETNSRSGPSSAPGPISAEPSSRAGRDHSNRGGSDGPRTEPISRRSRASTQQPAEQQLPTVDPQPPAVRGLRVIQINHDSITIRWNPVRSWAAHVAAISYYTATLNGIPAGETAGLELTINWFNDDMTGSHFIRVRAVDADGNRGLQSNALVVDRPATAAPRPSASTAPDPSSPAPDSSPTPSASPDSPSAGPLGAAPGTPPAPSAPTTDPTTGPTTKPTTEPTTKPTTKPTTRPTTRPTSAPTDGSSDLPAGRARHRDPVGDVPNRVAPIFPPSPTGRS